MEENKTVNRFYSTSRERRQNTKVEWMWCFIFSLVGRHWNSLCAVFFDSQWGRSNSDETVVKSQQFLLMGWSMSHFFPKEILIYCLFTEVSIFCCSLQSLNQKLPSLKPSIYSQSPILFLLIAAWIFATKFSSEGIYWLHHWSLSWNRVAHLRHKNDFKVKYFHPSSTSAFLQAAGNTLHCSESYSVTVLMREGTGKI